MPGTLDTAEVRVGANAHVFTAPTGTTGPSDLSTPLNAAFVDLGFVSEAGFVITASQTITDIPGLQSFYALRRVPTARDFTIGFALRQWNFETMEAAFGGGSIEVLGGGEFQFHPPAPEDINEVSIVLEYTDEGNSYRFYLPKALQTENTTSTLSRTAAADLPCTFSVAPTDVTVDAWTFFTDDPAFGS